MPNSNTLPSMEIVTITLTRIEVLHLSTIAKIVKPELTKLFPTISKEFTNIMDSIDNQFYEQTNLALITFPKTKENGS